GFKDFQTNYLNCKNKDAINNLKEYAVQINQNSQPAGNFVNENATPITNITLKTFSQTEIQAITGIFAQSLGSAPNIQVMDLSNLTEIVLGCTINQTIPMLDPVITAQLSTSCDAADRQAFYAMASHDVALASTRDVYRYLATQLKQVRSRLESEPLKSASSTTAGTTGGTAGGATAGATAEDSPDSPELRRRLAAAITNVMLPAVESQLERLNELEKTRGQFAKRVETIYATKRGCVYTTGQGNQPTN
ncbi:MAG: hypothetical protein EBR79_03660, partial [Proteobacteria bacterium]|nr:hypothetical protein [Pseudomonadota bacterium]